MVALGIFIMSSSAKFLDAFAAIEKLLRKMSGADRQVAFYQLVDAAAQQSPAVRRHKDDLKEYADLRNAIIHERSDGRAIAEPHERVVFELQRLAVALANPPRVLPLFQRKVHSVEITDRICEVLASFFPRNFSQVPVMSHGRLVGLLTTTTVSRWLAAQARHGLVDLTDHSVGDALKHIEHEGNWRVVARSALLADVLDAFDVAKAAGKRLDAVLVTHSGRPTEALIGIITIHDMPKILRSLSAPGRKTRAVRGDLPRR